MMKNFDHCPCREITQVNVKIPTDLSCSGEEKWKQIGIDRCVADLVDALQTAGIDMRGSCCRHGTSAGEIHLQDGRVLLVLSSKDGLMFILNRSAWHFRELERLARHWEQRAQEQGILDENNLANIKRGS